MACGAILRSTFLPMAREATSHVVAHQFHGYGCLRHVAMARRAAHACLVMLRVLEFHVSRWGEFIDALPGNFNLLIGVRNDFLNFRFIAAQLGMAQHALAHRRNARIGSRVGANVAVDAIKPHFEMRVVWKCDWLLRAHGQRCRQ